MARVARMPLADEALAVLGSALRDPNVVLRYQAKIVPCLSQSVCGGAGPSRGEVTDASTPAPWLIPAPALMVLGRVSGSYASSRTGLGTPWCTAQPR